MIKWNYAMLIIFHIISHKIKKIDQKNILFKFLISYVNEHLKHLSGLDVFYACLILLDCHNY